jgi:tetratricopeptide (TPR) repeat protein/DNA-binding XRE family transcriptional regulator/ABC-type cobalamin/Fe3+-siderophores transport system ATPase subunit
MLNTQRLDLLRQLREEAGLSQEDAARLLGLTGRQSRLTVGAWERGEYAPDERRRSKFIAYLWDHLRLRQDTQRFEAVWMLLVETWGWAELSDEEWRRLTQQPRTVEPKKQRSAAVAPFQAPPLTPFFVGRTGELAQLYTHFTAGTGRIVALVGMGGVGKTTLATQIAHQLRPHFADGVLWAEASTNDPMPILQSWAQAFGHDLSEINDLPSRAAAMRGILAEKAVLIVLDDVRSPEAVRLLLPGVTSCAVLLTTRDQDNARILNAQPFVIEEFSEQESIDLLVEMLGRERVAAEPEAASNICRLAHYLPLALEICAKLLARVGWQQLSDLEHRLRDETRRLHHLALKDLNVRAAFEVSWQTLNAEQRQLFATLGIFAGRAFSPAALAYVSQCTVEDVTDQLITFVSLSLVKSPKPGIFQQHPLLADFAQSQLEDETPVQQRFSSYYLTFCQTHSPNVLVLEGEFENIMRAMQLADAQQQWRMVMDYADTLAAYWLRRARYSEGRLGLQWSCTAAKALGADATRVEYLIQWGLLCAEQNEQQEARSHLQAGLELAEQLGAARPLADAQYHLARLAVEQAHYEEADEWLTKCQDLYQALGHSAGVARSLHLRALLLHRLAQYGQSNSLCLQALELQERAHEITDLLATLRLLTDNAFEEQDLTRAEAYALRSLQLATQYHDHSELVKTYWNLATLYRRLARYPEALDYAEKAIERFTQMGNRAFTSYALYEKSMTQKLMGDYHASLATGQHALAIMTELADEYNRIYCLNHVGTLYWQLQQPLAAQQCWETALLLAKQLHHPKTSELEAHLRNCTS